VQHALSFPGSLTKRRAVHNFDDKEYKKTGKRKTKCLQGHVINIPFKVVTIDHNFTPGEEQPARSLRGMAWGN
jgi:hypothetical protein